MAGPGGDDIGELCAEAARAVAVMYDGRDATAAKRALRWLEDLQDSDKAWDVGSALLASPHSSSEAKFLGLSMMQRFVSLAYRSAGDAGREEIRQAAIDAYLSSVASGNRLIVTKAAVLVATVAIRALPAGWNNVVADIMSLHAEGENGGALDAASARVGALTFCRVFVQEAAETAVPAATRTALAEEYRRGAPAVLALCEEELSVAGDPHRVRAALQCLEAWVNLPSGPVTPDVVADFVERLLALVLEGEVRECATDVLVALVRHPLSDKHPRLIKALVPAANAFAEPFRAAVESYDHDGAAELARFAVMLADNHLRTILDAADEAEADATRELVGFVMQILGYPAQYPTEETVSKTTLYFWGIFMDSVSDPETDEQLERYKGLYYDLFLPLLETILSKLVRPEDDGELAVEDLRDFNEYRADLRDLIASLQLIVWSDCQRVLVDALESAIVASERGDGGVGGGGGAAWRAAEAALQGLCGSADTVRDDEDTHTPRLFACLSRLPDHPHVVRTALRTIAEYAEWLDKHPEHLPHVVDLLLGALSARAFVEPTLKALRRVSETCAEHLEGDAFERMLGPCAELFRDAVGSAHRQSVVHAMCKMISGVPHARALEETAAMCEPALGVVLCLADGVGAAADETSVDAAFRELNLVCRSVVLRHPVPELDHPVLAVVKAAWPALEALLGEPRARGDDEVVSVAWTMLKSACVTLESLTSVFLEPLLGTAAGGGGGGGGDAGGGGGGEGDGGHQGMFVVSFASCPTRACLECVVQIVAEYRQWDEMVEPIAVLITRLAECYAARFDDLREDPDVTAAFFDLVWKVMRVAPRSFFLNPELPAVVLRVATAGLALPEHASVKAAVKPLVAIAESGKGEPAAAAALQAHSGELLETCYAGLAGGMDRSIALVELAKVLRALNKAMPAEVAAWSTALLSHDGFPTDACPPAAKQTLVAQLKMPLGKLEFDRAVERFANACRGFCRV